ncbi:MAG: hypothetical protein NC827_06335 [Candidatus Omnitrophica bacterium]|nr:hypothetical protein [Candidatus Omnitrophota bacterium]MCM8802907.1 hypothetical protein [Candidatus Omnitrophota bacterium]
MEWFKKDIYLKIIRREGYGFIPCVVSINGEIWDQNSEYFENLKKECPDIYIVASKNPEMERENFKKDEWGCLWHYPGKYLDGQVVKHPLSDWSLFDSYRPPEPLKYRNWEEIKNNVEKAKKEGEIIYLGVEHGFFYLRLTYLRGFENFMIDVGLEEPKLKKLIEILTEYWKVIIKKYVEFEPDIISFGDDLGHQNSLPISPIKWRSLIKPSYKEIFSICRRKNIEVYLHTDGYIVDIIPDLIECGVTVLNPQDLVNGIDNLEKIAKGKVTIDLDIDRQKITFFGKSQEIDQHIKKSIEKLGSQKGGLLLKYGAYPGTPVENISQVIRAMQKYCKIWV